MNKPPNTTLTHNSKRNDRGYHTDALRRTVRLRNFAMDRVIEENGRRQGVHLKYERRIVQVHARVGKEQKRARQQDHGEPQQGPGCGIVQNFGRLGMLDSKTQEPVIHSGDQPDGPRERGNMKALSNRENPLRAIQCVRYGVNL